MKKYITPEMMLSCFDRENIVTQSGAQPTAVEQAQTAANAVEGSQKTFTVIY